jgi:hypothetical protein
MKNLTIFILTGIFALSLVSCGGSGEEKAKDDASNKVSEEKKVEKKEEKSEKLLTFQLGDEKKTYKTVYFKHNRMADVLKISAFEEGNNESVFSLSFEGTKSGKMKEPNLSIDGYKVEEVSGKVISINTAKKQYSRGISIESIKGTFQAKVKKEDGNIDPKGETIEVSGNFRK